MSCSVGLRRAALLGLSAMLLLACRPLTSDPFTVIPIGDVGVWAPNDDLLAVAHINDDSVDPPVRRPGVVDLTTDTVIPLAGLGGSSDRVAAINDHGVVVGVAHDPASGRFAAVWRQSAEWELEVVEVLGQRAALADVNNQGLAVGTVQTTSAGPPRPVAYDIDSGTVTELPELGSDDASPVAVTDSGLVVGHTRLPGNQFRLWTHQLGDAHSSLLSHPPEFEDSYASGVDPTGTLVIGMVSDRSRQPVPGPNDVGQLAVTAGILHDLSTGESTVLDPFGGGRAKATGVNSRGVVVGTSRTPDGIDHGFAYDSTTGRVVDLGLIHGARHAGSLAINDDLLVTGTGWDSSLHGSLAPPVPTPVRTVLHTTPDAPAAPTVLGCAGAVEVNWSAPTFDGNHPIEGFRVARYHDGEMSVLAEVGATVTTTIDADDIAGEATYVVVARNSLGSSAPSESTSLEIAACDS